MPESPRHLSLAAPGGPVLVPAERADTLARVTLPEGEVTTVPVGRYPHDAAVAGNRTFVGDEHGHTLTVLEGDRQVARKRIALQPGGVAATEDGRQVAVVSVRERVLELYDARTLERVGRAPAGVGPTHVVTGGGDRAYVADTTGDALLVFDLRPEVRLLRRVFMPGSPYGLTVDRRRGDIWVATTGDNRVTRLTGGYRPVPRERFPVVRQPDTVAVDEETGRVFVTGRVDGVLQYFDP